MKKLGTILLSAFCILFIGVTFTACKDEGTFSISQNTIELKVEERVDLLPLISLDKLELKDIEITSQDKDIALISPDYKVVGVGVGTTVVKLSYKEYFQNISVVVNKDPVTLNAPTGLYYDIELGGIVWNEVFGKIDDVSFKASEYTVAVKKQGENNFTETVVSNNTYFALTGAGTYTVKVKTNQRSSLILASNYSDEYTFTILSSPTNINFDEETQILTWDGTSSSYFVSVNGTKYETNEKSLKLNLNETKTYSIFVGATDENSIEAKSETIVITKLSAPNLNVIDGRLRWEAQNGVKEYQLVITDKSNNLPTQTEILDGAIISYKLEGDEYEPNKEYLITIKALGEDNYIASETSNQISVTKLQKTELYFNTENQTLSLINNPENNALVELKIQSDNGTSTVILSSENNYEFEFNRPVGDYVLTATVLAPSEEYLNADVSNSITISVLAPVSNLSHTVNQNNEGIITFDKIINANKYEIIKVYDNLENSLMSSIVVTEEQYNIGNVDGVFDNAGDYTLKVTAYNTTNGNNNHYYISSSQEIVITRLANTTIETPNEYRFNWQAVSNNVGYKYEFIKEKEDGEDEIIDINITNLTSYSFGNIYNQFGVYEFKVKAVGNNQNILDALEFASTTYIETYTLLDPELEFDEITEILSVSIVENADKVLVTINGEEITIVPTQQGNYNVYDISSLLIDAKEYLISSKAISDNSLIKESGIKELTITRLNPVSRITIDGDTVIVPEYEDYGVLQTNPYTLLINNKTTNKLENETTFEIKVSYNAIGKGGNGYYLNSPVATFNIERLVTPLKPEFLNGDIIANINTLEGVFTYLILSQGNITYEQIITENVDNLLDSAIFEVSNIDKEQPFTVSLRYGYDQDIIANNDGETRYISSLISEALTISKLKETGSLKIEKGETTKIVWEEVENAEDYVLTILKPNKQELSVLTGNVTSYDYTFDIVGKYEVKLKATSRSWLDSNNQKINVEKLDSYNKLSVDKDENLILNNISNSKLEKTLVEIESENIERQELTVLNLSNYNEDFKLYFTNIAKDTEQGTFYITSETTVYSFKRIAKINAVTLSENNISWTINDDASSYELKFEQNDVIKYLTVLGSTTNYISLDDTKIQNIISEFDEGNITISVRALTDEIIDMLPLSTASLSCLEYTVSNQSVDILSAPTDLKLTTSGDLNQNLNFYFSHDMNGVKAIDIYVNNNKLETFSASTLVKEEVNGTEYFVIKFTNAFLDEKTYNVNLVAVGNNGNISSKSSETLTFTRLKSVNKNSINIDASGNLKWQNITNASGYKIFLTLNGKEQKELEVTSNPLNIYNELLENEKLVVGDAEITIRTIGDGVEYLNSNDSEIYTFTILDIPTMEIGQDSITVNSVANTNVYFTITKQGRIVAELRLNPNDTYNIPTSFDAGEYVVTIYAKSTYSTGFITSQTYTQNFTKLEQVSGYKFVRVNDGNETYFRLVADNNQFASSYVLETSDYTTDQLIRQDSEIYINILNQLEQSIGTGRFEIKMQAIGGKIGSVYYTNSNISSITATRLEQVKDFVANKNLTWTNSVYNEGYLLRVNSDYVSLAQNSTTYAMSEYVGSLVLNIKVLGNVTYEGTSENAILDSKYIGAYDEQNVFVESNISATKLNEVDYLSVNDGYITFNYDSENEYELIASNGKTYLASNSTLIIDNDTNRVKLFNDQLYKDLATNQTYNLRVKVIAKNENILNSNLSELNIDIVIPENTIIPTWTLDELGIDANGKTIYNLANTKITWEDLTRGNGYLVRLNGVSKDYNINEYLIEDFESGRFTFEVAIKGSSSVNADGAYILTSKYSESKTFNVLGTTTISLNNGVLTWERVENASSYYIYLNDKATKIETSNTYLDENAVGYKIPSGTYNIYVQAVTTTENYFQGITTSYIDEDENLINVIKLDIPSALTLTNGTFTYEQSLNILGSTTPFRYEILNAVEQVLRYKFESKTGAIYYADVEALTHLNINVDSILRNPLFQSYLTEEYIEFLNDYKLKIYGWPNYTRLFDEYGKDIPAGEYQLTISQNGNDLNYLTSDFGNTRTVYVPNAPKIHVSFANDIYTLNISKVVIPENITTDEVVYDVYGVYLENGVTKYKLLSSSTSTSINLTELVNNGTIDETFTEFFAFVKGNSTNVLNGKTSNRIKVKVLTEIDTSIQEGILTWKSQSFAYGFKIRYTNATTGDSGEIVITDTSWNCDIWEEGNTYENVSIQALGTENNQVTTLVLTGPETEIGTIVKLNSVDWYIKDGVVYWNNIENSSKYYVNANEGINEEVSSSRHTFTLDTVFDGIVTFDPALTGNYSYFIKTIGSENLALSPSTVGYVNSNFAENLYTFKHTAVEEIKTIEGELTWKTLDKFVGYDIGNYLLTFKGEGQEDIIVEINSAFASYDGYNIVYKYGLETFTNLLAGDYKVYIQGFAKGSTLNTTNNNNNFSYYENGKTIYLLLSEKQANGFEMTKLDEVIDTIVTSISLDENKYTSSITFTDLTNDPNAVYELTFIEYTNSHSIVIRSDDEDRKDEFTYNSENSTWTFTGVINESMDYSQKIDYTLQIRRLATNSSEMNSNYTKYYDYENNTNYIVTQINPILETEIVLKEIDGKDHYVISWESYNPTGLSSSLVSYLFEYYSVNSKGEKGEVRRIYVTDNIKYVNYDTEIVQESGTAMLSYKVQVLIGSRNSSTLNFTNSRFSKDYEIKTPNSVDNITFDNEKQVFVWDYANTDTNNLVFIVKDYYVGANGTTILNLDNLETYERNEYTINILKGENTYEFAPQKIGAHIISIEVCVANFASTTVGNDEAFKSGAVFYQNVDGEYTEDFSLFTSGSGTSVDPYIVSSEKEFENINLRKITPSYIGSKYNFKQNRHLDINANITYESGEAKYSGFITGEFDGIYDGDGYSLKVISTIYELNTAEGLFARLSSTAEIKDLQLFANITGQVTSNVNFGVLTNVNYGKLTNIRVGNIGETGIIFNTIEYTVGFGMVALENRGTMDKVVNNYGINLTHSGRQNMASVNLGGLVKTNYGTIKNSANKGLISISTYEGAVVGGIASALDGGTISSSFNTGTITISYHTLGSGSSTNSYYIGGIVGNISNDNSSVINSYAIGNININHNNINPTAYIGGIAGNINLPNLVSNCYSNVTINIQTISAGISLNKLYYYLFVGNIRQSGSKNGTCYYLSSASQTVAGGTGANNFSAENYTQLNSIMTKLNSGAGDNLFYINGQQLNLIIEQELNSNDGWKN